MLRLRFTHSHIYPGALARMDAPAPNGRDTPCLVEFADGVEVPARFAGTPGALRLAVEAYTTARGARIQAKRWSLTPHGDEATVLRVTSRAAEPP